MCEGCHLKIPIHVFLPLCTFTSDWKNQNWMKNRFWINLKWKRACSIFQICILWNFNSTALFRAFHLFILLYLIFLQLECPSIQSFNFIIEVPFHILFGSHEWGMSYSQELPIPNPSMLPIACTYIVYGSCWKEIRNLTRHQHVKGLSYFIASPFCLVSWWACKNNKFNTKLIEERPWVIQKLK